MSGSTLHRSAVRTAATTAAAALAVTSLAVLTAPPATSAPDPNCPPAANIAALSEDQPVHGKTVHRGNTPAPFTGTYLGTIEDGIAPGLDMVMVRLTSPEIDRVGGIWAGMSGSPVYTQGGRLIGAVAYGLALGPSPVAGVTPASEMYKLLAAPPSGTDGSTSALSTTRTKDEVAIPQTLSRQLIASGEVSKAQASSGLERLPVPVGVSGLAPRRLAVLGSRLDLDGVRYHKAGATSATVSVAPATIAAGGNLGAAMSFGDLTAGGVGTTTVVCGNEVLGFGHPAFWTGRSTATMHGANALYVQDDPTLFPFKVANLTAPQGRLTDDRLAAINGDLGALPRLTPVRSRVSSEGRTRTGSTMVSFPDALPDLAAFAHLANLDRILDAFVVDGTARTRWIITGVSPSGRPFELDRTDRFASLYDITFESIFAPYEQLAAIQYFEGGVPRITNVELRAGVQDQLRLFRIGTVDAWQGGRWVRVPRRGLFRAKGGEAIRLRLSLPAYRGLAGTKRVEYTMRAPRSAVGRTLAMTISGGNDFEPFCEFEEECSERGGASTFGGLLRQLDGEVRNDEVVGVLSRFPGSPAIRQNRRMAWEVVGGQWSAWVRVVR